jgi:RNA polymerase sigma factor (sigma-70 family)
VISGDGLGNPGHSAHMLSAPATSGPLAGATLENAPAVAPPRGPLDFDAVYEEHFQFLFRALRRLGVAEASLDDALQDVFLAVHRRLDDFEGRSSVKTWLFGFALRVARDHRRRRARKGGLELLSVTLPDGAPSPLEQLEHAESLRLLDELSARYPGGVLHEERSAARVLALCAAGRKVEARAEASRFLEQNPRSVQVDRVRASCAFGP